MNDGANEYLQPGSIKCWYVNEAERERIAKTGKLFGEYSTSEYFSVVERIDNSFMRGYLGRTDSPYPWLYNWNAPLTYFIDYRARKHVYFTFDHIVLYQLVELIAGADGNKPLEFVLKRIDNKRFSKPNTAFMIMPFHSQELNGFYTSAIKPFLKSRCQTDIYRADDFRNNDIIVETIYRLIEESEVIIADTTFENKNAFYELGYASAKEKEIITIQNKNIEKRLFFDRAHIRSILYDPDDLESFFFDLEATITSIRSRQ